MAITLDHTIVPTNDQVAGAAFLARMFGLESVSNAPFEAVQLNEALTFDFEDAKEVESLHYAFLVSEDEFDVIFARIRAEGVEYGSGPFSAADAEINHRRGGRGLYFCGGPDPHLWEIMTRAETGS